MPTFNADMARRHLNLLHEGAPFEVRILRGGSGYPNYATVQDVEEAIGLLAKADSDAERGADLTGSYCTLHAIAQNVAAVRLQGIVRRSAIRDADIESFRWLPVDLDFKRESNTNATDAEREACHQVAIHMRDTLKAEGWPEPIYCCSGNGAHLLWRLECNGTSRSLAPMKVALKGLADRFNRGEVQVDQSVGNPSRIWKIAGTVSRKGPATLERPHRMARLISAPDIIKSINYDTMQMLAVNQDYEVDEVAAILATKAMYGDRQVLGTPANSNDIRRLNAYALAHLDLWVKKFFPKAREGDDGYRLSPTMLPGKQGRQDIKITPDYIIDFSVYVDPSRSVEREHLLTPIGLLAKYCYNSNLLSAAQALFSAMGLVPLRDAPAMTRQGFDMGLIETAHQLSARQLPPLGFLIDGMLPYGAYILASRPKMGKSYMLLQLLLAVITGGTFLDRPVKQGRVLMLGLEDNERRIQARMIRFYDVLDPPDLNKLHYFTPTSTGTQFPRGPAGIEVLHSFMDMHPDTRVITIDPLEVFRDLPKGHSKVYSADYEAVLPLTRFAAERSVVVIMVHHNRKGTAAAKADVGDYTENVSGSAGLTAAADGMLQIEGPRTEVDDDTDSPRWLMITARDLDSELKIPLTKMVGGVGWVRAKPTDLKLKLMAAFDAESMLTRKAIAVLCGTASKAAVDSAIRSLVGSNLIVVCTGGYRLPAPVSTEEL